MDTKTALDILSGLVTSKANEIAALTMAMESLKGTLVTQLSELEVKKVEVLERDNIINSKDNIIAQLQVDLSKLTEIPPVDGTTL